jgi:3-oxoacyl-[acyl-carrier-protein] synthase-1
MTLLDDRSIDGCLVCGVNSYLSAREATEVLGVGAAEEPATVLDDEPSPALGMTAAVRSALQAARLTFAEVDVRLSELGGESYEPLMLARLQRSRRESVPLWHPAEYIGTTGAAAGIALLVVAEEAFRNRAFPGSVALCTASTAGGGRGAVVLRHEQSAESPAKEQWAL